MKKRLVQRLLLVFLRSMTSKKSDCQQLCQCRFLSFPTLFFFQFLDQKRNLLFFSPKSFQETLILMLETSKTIVVSVDQTALKISLQGVSNLGNERVGLDSFVNKACYCYDVIREGIKAYLISHGQSSKSFLRNGIPRYIHGRGIHLETTKFSRWYENVSYNWCFFQNRKSGIGNQSDHNNTMAFKWYTISWLYWVKYHIPVFPLWNNCSNACNTLNVSEIRLHAIFGLQELPILLCLRFFPVPPYVKIQSYL